MISDKDLQRWIDYLDQQMVALDALHLATTGEPHLASPELVAFLKMNDGIVRDSVERAICHFADQKEWPSSLNGDEIVNLTHRMNAARVLLWAILTKQMKNVAILVMPKATDRPKLVRWLLIDSWRRSGDQYINGLTDRYLAEHRMGGSGRTQ